MYFKTETDAAQNLIDNFFSDLDCQTLTFSQEGFKEKKSMGIRG